MRSTRLIAARALGASAAALALAVGVGVSAPAAFAGDPLAACAWQPLPLINGWQGQQAAWGTGDPSYCVNGYGMVYLSGSLYQSLGGSGSSEFAVLPAAARPATTSYLSVYTYGGASGGVLRIQSDGEMLAYQGKAFSFTSLAGISFPAAGISQQSITPINGWKSAQGLYGDTGNPSYFVSDGVVHLSGSVYGGDPIQNPTFGYMPSSTWPTECTETGSYSYDGAIGGVQIQPNPGALNAWEGDVTDYTSLAGISYVPASTAAWQPLNLLNGWSSYGGDCYINNDHVYYQIIGGVVYLDGVINGSYGTGSPEFAMLPAGAAPSHTLYIALNDYSPRATLVIHPSGEMDLYSPSYPSGQSTLGAVSYHVGS